MLWILKYLHGFVPPIVHRDVKPHMHKGRHVVRAWGAGVGIAALLAAVTASGLICGVVRVCDVASGKLVRELAGHNGTVNRVVLSPDGQTLATTGDDHTVRIWLLSAGRTMHTLTEHRNEVWAAAFVRDSKTLVTGDKDDVVKVWDVYSGQARLSFRADLRGVTALAVRPAGRALAPLAATGRSTDIRAMPRRWQLSVD